MSARIARGNAASRPRARTKSSGKSVSRRKKAGFFDSLPLAADTVRRISWWIFVGMAAALAVTAMIGFKVPQLIGTAAGEGIGQAGFSLRHVEITGANHVSRLDIYNVAFDQPSEAMPLVDLESTRQRLMQFGWIQEARVSRRWPDTLVVDVVERRPAAIWQHNRRLALIDGEGVVLERVRLDAMPELPLVIGPDANRQAGALARLLDAAPPLKPIFAGATWVGARRWDLRFHSGEVLALPEGEEAARRAITNFVRMDQQAQLLGRGFARFDMRIPGRFIVRVSRQPGTIIPSTPPTAGQPAGTAAGPTDLSRTI